MTKVSPRPLRTLWATVLLYGIFSTASLAQAVDEDYNEKIREYTTDDRFLPNSVLNLTDDSSIPSPLRHFGEIIGAPGVMHRTEEIYGYYQALADASPLLQMESIGTTEEGRPIQLLIVGSEEALGRLDHYKEQLALLADPRKIESSDVEEIIADAMPVFYLNGGLHSPEMGSPEMLMELTYRLITSEAPEIKNILNNLIVIINPVAEPDGRDKQVDWYYRYTKDREEYDDGFKRSPPYWGRYVYHDNNRDGLQVSQQLTRAIFDVFYEWHPTEMLDLHESVPLIYMSTGTGPYNEGVDPITVGEWQVMANHDVTTLAAQGLPGAFTWAFYDGWWPGYAIWVANNHNSVGRFYETFGNAGANTYLRDISEQRYAGDLVTSREWYRPDPATGRVLWSSRNNVNYMEAAVIGALTYAANNGKQLLQNFYQKGANNIRQGKEETPRLLSIASDQSDPAMAAYLVNQLREQQVEVHYAETGENQGDYVVLLDQPYRNLAINLLSKQNYPQEAKFPPYDDIAWTLGLLYGVDVRAEDTLKYDLSDLKPVAEEVQYEGSLEGTGNTYVLDYQAQNTVLPAMYWLKSQNNDARMVVLDTTRVLEGVEDTLSAGTILFEGITEQQAQSIAADFGLDLRAASFDASEENQHEVTLPRVAIYHTWFSTQDEGWSRYTFDQRKIPYTSIDKDDLKAGDLRSKFDVILIPRIYGGASDFIQGIDEKFGPMPYTKTEEYPSHGVPDATDDMTGGPGFAGMEQLKKFAQEGGVLVSLDNATTPLAASGIARELESYSADGLFHPGSVVQVKARQPGNPVLYGYPEYFHIFRGNGPLFQVEKYDRDMILLQYGTQPLKDEEEFEGEIMGVPEDTPPADDTGTEEEPDEKEEAERPYVLSGMVRNEQSIVGHGSIFRVPVGEGCVVAFTFDPLHRFLNHHDAPLVWNVLINWDQLTPAE